MYQPPTLESIRCGAEQIYAAVSDASGTPFFIGRNGTIETEAIYFYLILRRGSGLQKPYPARIMEQMQRNAGIFPGTDATLDAWAEEYLYHLGSLTGLAAGWYEPLCHIESTILKNYAPKAFRTPLRSLEPYYSPDTLQWPRLLAGKKVAIVSSFTESIKRQLASSHAPHIWKGGHEGLLPIAEWSFIRTGYAPITAMGHAGWPREITTWEDAADYVVGGVLTAGAEVALIGCGGLGMIVAGRLRAAGVSTFVLGGAIQVLFGIKGARWERHDVISKFWNPTWVWPSEKEMPGGASLIEGGCYWGRKEKLV